MKSILRNFFFAGLLVCLFSCVLATGAIAQSVASLTVTVTDPSNAYIVDAEVHVRDFQTDNDHLVHSNKAGLASFPTLPPGAYTLLVVRSGFERYLSVITLATGDMRDIDVRLKPGAESVTVTVNSSDSAALDTDAALKTTVSQQEVANLPLNGRTFQNLIAITPGVARTGGAGLFSFNGQRDNTNYFMVDGVAANTGISEAQGYGLGQGGAGQAPSLSAAGTTSSLLSLDALDQITIQADNYAAEYGRSAGGQIALTSKAGNNSLHGSLFDYLRNDAFDAWNPYDKFIDTTEDAGIPKPPLRLNDFGGTLGGPIRIPWLYNGKNRSFFFVSYEGLREHQPATGIFEAVNASDIAQANPVLQTFLELAPPQGTNASGQPLFDQYGNPAYARSFSNFQGSDATSVRLDQNLGSKVNMFVRVAYAPSVSSGRTQFIGELDSTTGYNYTFTAGSSQTFTSNLVNQFRGNYTRSGGHNVSTLDNYGGATAPTATQYAQMFPAQFGASPLNSLFTFGDYDDAEFGFQVGTAQENTQRQVNLIDDLMWLKGRHQLKFGVDWRMLFPTAGPSTYSQTVAYYDPQTLASGDADIDIATSNDQITVHQQDVAFFAEDSWHATRNLTINAGLRLDVDPAPYAVDGQTLYIVQNSGNLNYNNLTLQPAGTPLYPTRYNQFQPRISVAYVVSHKAGLETLIKGGFGSFYVPAADTALSSTGFYPHSRSTVLLNQQWFTDPAPPIPASSASLQYQDLLTYSPNFVTPRTYEWNLSVQQNLGAKRTFTLAYVGSAGRDLTRLSSFSGSNYPQSFGDLSEYFPVDTSDYNALQASYVQHLRSGLSVMANYTWGHSFDTASGDETPGGVFQDPSVKGERGPSDFDERNSANVAVTYDAPKLHHGFRVARAVLNGWGSSAIFQVHSGNPLTVTLTDYVTSQQSYTVRPDITPGVPVYLYGPQYFGGRSLNPAAFNGNFLINSTQPGLEGDEPRGYLVDRGFDELDLQIKRDFKIAKYTTLQYRCEFFNLPNQTSYAPPNTQLGTFASGMLETSSVFGGVTNTYNNTATTGTSPTFGVGGPRSLEMALRLSF